MLSSPPLVRRACWLTENYVHACRMLAQGLQAKVQKTIINSRENEVSYVGVTVHAKEGTEMLSLRLSQLFPASVV